MMSSLLRTAVAFLGLFGAGAEMVERNDANEDSRPAFALAFQNAEPALPRSAKEIKETLKKIAGPPRKGKDDAAQRDAALRRLQAYRYLAGVPYEDLTLDDDFNRKAQAASKLCEKLKRLDHNPPNAGLTADEYKLAKAGAAGSNLGYGFARLADSVDYYIGDYHSEQLGHRRWTLYPYLTKVGFGRSGTYSAMFLMGPSTWAKKVPDFEFVSWPPPGYMPAEMFKPNFSWNVSLNPEKFKALEPGAQARLFQADAQLHKVGEPIKLSLHKLDNLAIGLPYCVIFRPEKITIAGGKRYLVEVSGLKSADGKPARTISYPVVFMTLK